MPRSGLAFCIAVLAVVGAFILSCGSSPQRELQNISMAPATADAQQFPGGYVPFVITGYFNTSPATVTPVSATFGACFQSAPTNDIKISIAGVAQCGSGAVGTYLIWANDPLPTNGTFSCTAQSVCGGGCVLQATAQLTCP